MAIETKETIGSEGLQHNVDVAFVLKSTVPVHEAVHQTNMDVVHGVDKEKRGDTSDTTGDHGTNESLGIAIRLVVVERLRHGLEKIHEGMIEHLGGDVNDHIGHVSAEERPDTLVSKDTLEAVDDTLVGTGETTRLDQSSSWHWRRSLIRSKGATPDLENAGSTTVKDGVRGNKRRNDSDSAAI